MILIIIQFRNNSIFKHSTLWTTLKNSNEFDEVEEEK